MCVRVSTSSGRASKAVFQAILGTDGVSERPDQTETWQQALLLPGWSLVASAALGAVFSLIRDADQSVVIGRRL